MEQGALVTERTSSHKVSQCQLNQVIDTFLVSFCLPAVAGGCVGSQLNT